MNKKVIYTVIFGGYDQLQEPECIPTGWDFICFSDHDYDSSVWEVRVVDPAIPQDLALSSRKPKILAHEFLPEYNTSIYIDGNIVVRGNVNELTDEYLEDSSFVAYSHRSTDSNGRTGLYQEAETLIQMTESGKYKGDPQKMRKQMIKYRREGYPEENGLILGTILLRRHNDQKVKQVMQDWWNEVKNESNRDQLSFNYVAWKHDFDFTVIEENGWDNEYFYRKKHHIPWYKKPKLYIKYIYRRIKNFFNAK